jgi:pyridoxamine 5'-phosphate oxidase
MWEQRRMRSSSRLDPHGAPHYEAGMIDDPFALFDSWFTEARASEPNDANAMALATSTPGGRPSLRMVLLKGHGPDGFVFYTNLDSRKGGELAANPQVALLFHWKSLRRQIRIEGPVTPVDDATADAYFATRGRDSQLGAWASDQSRPLGSRETFEARFAEMQARFEGQDVPRPPRWSGWRVAPERIEFWQDREHRLHERTLYVRDGERWTKGLLYP